MATAIHLVWTGIAMGVVHVLTGPDHLSALATLSSSSSSSSSSEAYPQVSKCYLFGLGARWGIGHSTGLMLVGGFFILKDVLQNGDGDGDGDDKRLEIPDAVTRSFESFVGIFMLVLGFYGIYEARRIRYNEYAIVNRSSNGSGEDNFVNPGNETAAKAGNLRTPLEVEATEIGSDDGYGGDSAPRRPGYKHPDDDLEEFRYNVQVMFGTVSTEDDANGTNEASGDGNFDHHHHHDHSNSPFLALCAGIFHGLAGPGGVLGVVPAIQLHDPGLAACYLFSFCASATLTMGTFASVYGTFTSSLARCISSKTEPNKKERSSRNITASTEDEKSSDDSDDSPESSVVVVEFWIRCFSASLSLLVGVAWLVLLATGKLEELVGR